MRFLFYVSLCAMCLFIACELPQQPRFVKIDNLQLGNISSKDIKVNGNLILNNPNALGAKVVGTELDVFIDTDKVGHISQTENITVPAAQDFSVPMQGSIPLSGLGLKAISLFGKQKIKARFEGHVLVKIMEIDFKVPVKFEHNIK